MGITFTIDTKSYANVLSELNVSVAHTYVGDIKRTLKGVVTSFPVSYRTIGVNVVMIGKVTELTEAMNQMQVPKVTLDFDDTVYVCDGGIFSCTEVDIERLHDNKDKLGRLTASFVSVGIPTIEVQGEDVVITAPDN